VSRTLKCFLAGTWLAGLGVAVSAIGAFALPGQVDQKSAAIYFITLVALAIIAELKPVPYTLGRAGKDESLTIAVILLTLFAFGWTPAVFVAGASVLVADIVSNRVYFKTLFNLAMYVLATAAAASAYHLLGRILQAAFPPHILIEILTRFASGCVYYLANIALLMTVLSEVQGTRWKHMILWGLRDSATVNLVLISIAVGMSLLWEFHPVAAAVLVPSILMTQIGYKGYTRLRTEAESMLGALADLIDLRDDQTGQHSRRVAEMCYGVARLLGLSEEESVSIQSIARVHDVGKIVVRDAVLLKAGPLSPEEQRAMQAHVKAGAQVLSHLSVYAPHVPILLQHHERLDGHGYPNGARGDEIGLGARILGVCDAFDTMTSDRPYKVQVAEHAALSELYRHAGRQYDPKVVEALEAWLIQERRLRADWRALGQDLPQSSDILPGGNGQRTAVGLSPVAASTSRP